MWVLVDWLIGDWLIGDWGLVDWGLRLFENFSGYDLRDFGNHLRKFPTCGQYVSP
jgi:hypothetical protein